MLISKTLTTYLYVTIFFFAGVITLPSQLASAEEKNIEELILKLGAKKFRERKQAVKDLIKLGFYARSAVQDALKAKDPEVRANALQVWQQIKNIITPYNSKKVSLFIKKIKNSEAKQSDWLEIMNLLDENSLSVILQLIEIVKEEPVATPKSDKFKFTQITLLKSFLSFYPLEKIKIMTNALGKSDKDKFNNISKLCIEQLNTYEQSLILKSSAQILSAIESLELLDKIDLKSPLVVHSISSNWLKYYKNSLANIKHDLKFRAVHILTSRDLLSKDELEDFIKVNPLSTINDKLCSLFYLWHSKNISITHWEKLFKGSQVSWHQLALLQINKQLSFTETQKLAFKDINNRSQMLELIDRFFYFKDIAAIPLMAKIHELVQDKPSDLYNENLLLLDHYSRVGDFKNAQKYLLLYNKSEARKDDRNFDFFSEQQNKISDKACKLLKSINIKPQSPQDSIPILQKAIEPKNLSWI